jgi:hypothetical protein
MTYQMLLGPIMALVTGPIPTNQFPKEGEIEVETEKKKVVRKPPSENLNSLANKEPPYTLADELLVAAMTRCCRNQRSEFSVYDGKEV